MTDITVRVVEQPVEIEIVQQTIEVEVGAGVGPAGSQGPMGSVELDGFPITIIGAAADGTDQSAVINAALADAANSICMLPAGIFSIEAAIEVPEGKQLLGAGAGRTVIKVMPGFGPLPAGNGSIVLSGDDTRVADIFLDVDKTNNGGSASLRVHGYVMMGQRCVVERCIAKDVTGYAFWFNGGSPATPASGTCRDCYAENFNVGFETNNCDGVLYENCLADDGDNDIACEAVFHPLSGSNNVTYRNCMYFGDTTIVNCTANVGAQKNIVFDNVRGLCTGAVIAVYIGGASANEVTFTNCYFVGANNCLQAETSAHFVRGESSHFESTNGIGVTFTSGTGRFTNCMGKGASASNVVYGLFALGADVTWAGGDLVAEGTPGSAASNGGATVTTHTKLTPAAAGGPTLSTGNFSTDKGVRIRGNAYEGGTANDDPEMLEAGYDPASDTAYLVALHRAALLNKKLWLRSSELDVRLSVATSAEVSHFKVTTSKISAKTSLLGNYANDAAAAAGGVAVGEWYRNGSALMIRMA